MISHDLIESVKQHEGFRSKAYQDTEGVWTIGYGTNLQVLSDFPEHYAEFFLKRDLINCAYALSQKACWRELGRVRQDVLIEMAYNLGIAGLNKFRKMWAAIDVADYATAAEEMLDSKWAKQVGVRAIRLSRRMRTGVS